MTPPDERIRLSWMARGRHRFVVCFGDVPIASAETFEAARAYVLFALQRSYDTGRARIFVRSSVVDASTGHTLATTTGAP